MSKIAVDRQILEQALEALENSSPDQYPEDAGVFYDAKDALRAALEQPQQEPVAWRYWHSNGDGTESESVHIGQELPAWRNPLREPVPLYTHLPSREWRGLTAAEIGAISDQIERSDFFDIVIPFARAIEDKLKEKNT